MLRGLLMAPVLLVMVLFALSNRQVDRFGLWPTDLSLDAPVSLAVLIVAAVFFVIGALIAWSGSVGVRRRLRRADRAIAALEAQLAAARANPVSSGPQPIRPVLLPPS